MELIKENVIFTVNPPLEFIHALNFVANKEELYKYYSDLNFIPTDEFKQTVEKMKSNLSRYIQNELRAFFQWEPMKHILGRIIEENKNIKNAPSFISFLEQMDENTLINYMVGQALYGANADRKANWSMSEEISSLDDDTSIDKERLIEYVENPLETKSRLVLLMKQFYERSYKENESNILAELDKAKKRYEKTYHEDSPYFADEYLNVLPTEDNKYLFIHISYFIQVRVWFFDINPYKDTKWITIGMYSEYYPRKKFIKANVQKLIKILSDNKRFEIIELLSKKPCYVNELAFELELTAPTVCYHLNYMLDLNLVSLERDNGKTYYTLKKEKVKELFNQASYILLNEKE